MIFKVEPRSVILSMCKSGLQFEEYLHTKNTCSSDIAKWKSIFTSVLYKACVKKGGLALLNNNSEIRKAYMEDGLKM